jgi:hypothetical protein
MSIGALLITLCALLSSGVTHSLGEAMSGKSGMGWLARAGITWAIARRQLNFAWSLLDIPSGTREDEDLRRFAKHCDVQFSLEVVYAR